MTIKLLSHDFEILLDTPAHWSENGLGRASLRDQIIRLNAGMRQDAYTSTLLHEIIHMIGDILDLGLSEQQVSGVAAGMFSLLKDNEKILEGLSIDAH